MKKKLFLVKAPLILVFAYVCITNIYTVLANKGRLTMADLESIVSANAACENIPSKNNGDCTENSSSISCEPSSFWHDCYR